jgi:multiple RNA-binding domain-containing protein 1
VAGAVLDRDSSNMAVRLAVGETTLLAENKEFFDKEGVDLRALEGQIHLDRTFIEICPKID